MKMTAIKKPFVRTQYNYDRNAASNASGLACPEATLAQQHFKDECDINHIVSLYLKTGIAPQTAQNASYGDFSHAVDYHTALNQIIAAQDDFMRLPPQLRAEFKNDPGALLDFLSNEENRDRAIELGLVAKSTENVGENPTKVESKSAAEGEQHS
jgi:phage internal scaffolding protein